MKVDGPRAIEAPRVTRARAAPGSGATFAPDTAGETRAARVSGGVAIATVDALIALQEAPDALKGRAKAARRGRDMLDLLDDVRHGMLVGSVSRGTLQRLVALVDARREDFVDPGLSAVLDEIELRARVELAKLNFDPGRSAGAEPEQKQ